MFSQIICDRGVGTSWPVWESNPCFNQITARDDSSTLNVLVKAPWLQSPFTLLRLSQEFWEVGGLDSTEEENETWKAVIPRVTPAVTGRTQDRHAHVLLLYLGLL